jgi:hypothetical protein
LQEFRLRLKRHPSSSRTLARHLPFKSSTACRALAPAASFRGPLCFASLSAKKYGTPYFSARNLTQNIPEAAPKASRSFSVSEKLARYGSSGLSGVEHLRLLVGKDSHADALLRYFGSLKALSRASFKELRQFLPKGKAEAVMAALSMSNVADAEHAFIGSPE